MTNTSILYLPRRSVTALPAFGRRGGQRRPERHVPVHRHCPRREEQALATGGCPARQGWRWRACGHTVEADGTSFPHSSSPPSRSSPMSFCSLRRDCEHPPPSIFLMIYECVCVCAQNRPSVITCAPANNRNCNLSHCTVSHNGCSSGLASNYRRVSSCK